MFSQSVLYIYITIYINTFLKNQHAALTETTDLNLHRCIDRVDKTPVGLVHVRLPPGGSFDNCGPQRPGANMGPAGPAAQK